MLSPSIRACVVILLPAVLPSAAAAPPVLLDDRFELPPGFHIYRAASPELTGGSYDIAFDGDGRLLVGDGNAIRRLKDQDLDGVYDQFEVIATGLGRRGPQGLLVSEGLYAVGGDGLQLFAREFARDGSIQLVHRGRLGEMFNTGGDHDLHTVLRGYDHWLYLMAGNGAGVEGRKHITEPNSPRMTEREASVFRLLDPYDGKHWECVASGGRNPPSLGMHYTGELFSFDSDMEWHVGLPWYKPVRLNHWAIGSDQGWQEVGAYPSYFIDCMPHVLAVGRGSPNWGVFYEHNQYPARYRHAFIVCDYRWKAESNDQYATPGRLAVFFVERDGAGWKATFETLARPKPDARDAEDKPVNFALVDVEVAPDGSLLVSDHNQGLWRIFFDAQPTPPVPPLVPAPARLPENKAAALLELLRLPQPLAEWSRLRMEKLIKILEGTVPDSPTFNTANTWNKDLIAFTSNREAATEDRLRAMQLAYRIYPPSLYKLARDPEPEIRGQIAWLLGQSGFPPPESVMLELMGDADPMVRRRAAETLTRVSSPEIVPALLEHLSDSHRLVRYIAMNALAHHPAQEWLEKGLAQHSPQTAMRTLVAAQSSNQTVPPERLHSVLGRLLAEVLVSESAEDRLDLMRVLALFDQAVEANADTRAAVVRFLLTEFPSNDRDVRWEQVRLLGRFAVGESFGKLLALLRSEKDEVTQFHVAQSLARLTGGWTASEEEQALTWFESTQKGWFAEFVGKGVEFPQFWATTISDFCSNHREAVLRHAAQIDVTSLLGAGLVELVATEDVNGAPLIDLYQKQTSVPARTRIAKALRRVTGPPVSAFLRREIAQTTAPEVRNALWQSLSAQRVDPDNIPVLAVAIGLAPPEIARDCATALAKHRPKPEAALAEACLEHLSAGAQAFYSCEKLLGVLSGKQRLDFVEPANTDRRPDAPVRKAALAFWSQWFAETFGRPFVARAGSSAIKSDEEVHRLILADGARDGDPSRGATVYEALGCHACHGGGAAPGREGHLFGPDLAGVTRRLTRAELADSLAYPSKLVADRFKAYQLERHDGTVLAGFVTERTADAVTFADAAQVHRIPQSDIARLAPQEKSLMPEHLLNPLRSSQIRDLLAFLENIGVSPQSQPGP